MVKCESGRWQTMRLYRREPRASIGIFDYDAGCVLRHDGDGTQNASPGTAPPVLPPSRTSNPANNRAEQSQSDGAGTETPNGMDVTGEVCRAGVRAGAERPRPS